VCVLITQRCGYKQALVKVETTVFICGNYGEKLRIYTLCSYPNGCYISALKTILQMAKAKKISAEEAMNDLKKRKHHVAHEDAAAMVKKYQSFRTKLASSKASGGALPPKTPVVKAFAFTRLSAKAG
jgi:hypothetical protein